MYTFNTYQKEVIEADAEIQSLKERIRMLEARKKRLRWVLLRSPITMIKFKQARNKHNGKS
jgi:hypothetical protein